MFRWLSCGIQFGSQMTNSSRVGHFETHPLWPLLKKVQFTLINEGKSYSNIGFSYTISTFYYKCLIHLFTANVIDHFSQNNIQQHYKTFGGEYQIGYGNTVLRHFHVYASITHEMVILKKALPVPLAPHPGLTWLQRPQQLDHNLTNLKHTSTVFEMIQRWRKNEDYINNGCIKH